MHIGQRMRRVALQSALGGMAASVIGMVAASLRFLPPLWGAIGQEVIDLIAVLNAVRVHSRPKIYKIFDFFSQARQDMFVQNQKAGRLWFFLVGQNDHRSNRAFIWGSVQAPIGIAAFVTVCGRCTTV